MPRTRAASTSVGTGAARARARHAGGAPRPTPSAPTRRPTIRRSSTTRPGRRASRRGSSMRIATSSATRSSSTATRSRTASVSTGWASGRGLPGSRRCSGRGGSARCSASIGVRAGFDPHKQLDFLSRHQVTNVFTTPTAMRSMMAIDDAGDAISAGVPPRVLRGRAAEPRGDPLVPRAVRRHGARLLRADGVVSARRELPVPRGARGLDGQADAGLGRGDPRRGRAAGRAGRARRDLPARPLEPALSARLLEERGGERARRSAASGSTRRTPPSRTRTATSGTRDAPTT